MRIINRDHDVIDAEFRVIYPAPHGLTPEAEFAIAMLLGVACMLSIGIGTYLGVPISGMTAAVLLASFASLLTTTHRHLAPVGFAITVALGLSACSPTPSVQAVSTPKDKAAIDTSIREASHYRDPREGWSPKPMPLPGSSQPSHSPKKEAGHGSR